ncbi:PLP-dependent aminotransferase family protein [Chitinophaga horti]|uniref:PLP-dependent aminotransferase family protein n=1 Tax=Chitinophaga horti TaxID=2920382 RepID=A0ABY6J3S6_9BACT|nr:PLP-dependent aminotransferase family protein [Chitinophaga horti]UYQ92852.1 PLP-dependent aminotransferase family protein [Chitinophaga horti]
MLNLRVNYPSIPQEMDVFEKYTAGFTAPEKYNLLRTPASCYVDELSAQTLINWLHADVEAVSRSSRIATLPSANSALFCILSWFRSRETNVLIEETTFPGFRMCAEHFGYQQIPVACDEHGIIPDSLRMHLQSGKSRLVYIQPTLHNPSCFVMPLERREAILSVVREFDEVYLLEDDAYRFLHDNPPPTFLSLAPERTIHVYSLSKPFNPFLKSAYIVHPKNILDGLENLIRLTTSSGCSLFQDFGQYLFKSGELRKIVNEKQRVAREWHDKIDRLFSGLEYTLYPGSFHIWLSLGQMNCFALSDYLRTQQIDVTDGADFSASGDPHHIRIAFGSEWSSPRLQPALTLIADKVREGNGY